MYRQRKQIRTDSKKESKSGQRKQKVATRIALSKKMRVPASKLKGKTFQELMDLATIVNSGDISGAKELLEIQEMIKDEDEDEEEEDKVEDNSIGIISNFMTEIVPSKRAKVQKVRPPSPQRPPPIRPDLSNQFAEEGKYDYLDYEDDIESPFTAPKDEPPMVPILRKPPVYNDARIDDSRVFRDNFIREINSGLTGLELNPSIPISEKAGRMNRVRDVIDEEEQKIERPLNDNGEPILEQNNQLEGPVDELVHADPNDDRTQLNTGVARLAENNQYSDQQKAFLQRNEANRRIQNRIKKSNLDMNLGRAGVPLGERDDEEKYGDQDDFGGGMGDYGPDLMEERVTENSRSNRELIENAIERQTLQPRARWTGNRSVTADYQRQSVADRIGSSLSNSQSLNRMRSSPIPWKRPSRTYANNYVGLVRNSNRSMILAVNRLEA